MDIYIVGERLSEFHRQVLAEQDWKKVHSDHKIMLEHLPRTKSANNFAYSLSKACVSHRSVIKDMTYLKQNKNINWQNTSNLLTGRIICSYLQLRKPVSRKSLCRYIMFVNTLNTNMFQVLKLMAFSFSLTLLYFFSVKNRNISSRDNILFTKLVPTVCSMSDRRPDSVNFFHTKLYFMAPVIFPKEMHLSQDKGISPGTQK